MSGSGDTEAPAVRYLSTFIPVTDEYLIDAGMASPEVIARDAARREHWRAVFAALPWYVRFARMQVYPRWHEAKLRVAHVIRAVRGIECERD